MVLQDVQISSDGRRQQAFRLPSILLPPFFQTKDKSWSFSW
jgi:hypothetical protein